jgi:hypothetical protein
MENLPQTVPDQASSLPSSPLINAGWLNRLLVRIVGKIYSKARGRIPGLCLGHSTSSMDGASHLLEHLAYSLPANVGCVSILSDHIKGDMLAKDWTK